MTKQRVTRRKRRQTSDRAPAGLYGTRPGEGAANSSGSCESLNRPPVSTAPGSGDGTRPGCTCNIFGMATLEDHAEACTYRVSCEELFGEFGSPVSSVDGTQISDGTRSADGTPICTCNIFGMVDLGEHASACPYRVSIETAEADVAALLAAAVPGLPDGTPISTSDRYKPGVLDPSSATGQPVGADGDPVGPILQTPSGRYILPDGTTTRDLSEAHAAWPGAGPIVSLDTAPLDAPLPVYGPAPASGLDDVLQRLDAMTVLGSCTCMRKEKRPSAHGTRCPYRIMREAAVEIRILRPTDGRGMPLVVPDPVDLQRRLGLVTEGSCSCPQKGVSREVADHRPLCRYRLLKEAEEMIWLFIPDAQR
jgi:hypothetical protein